ncbi:MAG: hypothetical protein NDI90_01135 [Nitrospira sp. BO4]|jgi:hypothetical protein|nr:hypothetical protein [Nitrospira sp. BO4]
MRCLLALLVILTSPVFAVAGEPDTLLSLVADYADHKQRVQDFRATRGKGSSRDTGQLIELKRELLVAIKAVDEYRARLLRSREEAVAHDVPLALKSAYLAMFHVISMELDHTLYRSDLALTLSEKYVDIWLAVDPSIPVMAVP